MEWAKRTPWARDRVIKLQIKTPGLTSLHGGKEETI